MKKLVSKGRLAGHDPAYDAALRERGVSALNASPAQVLVVNAGSSSVKFGIYPGAMVPGPILTGAIEGIGRGSARLHLPMPRV